ncbi:uncharacterized protein LOC129592451 [Paramacrobiotus metropolitanus]|uniref:uncharacterized protein LOC129592451 n=1 Tax=Paramacrobiotus metropolitanus TaxID=2943436 RepID=UPI002445D879|nr:uncharacterized protein LOC129592451 [Paramacrobiotus metropolitanus]
MLIYGGDDEDAVHEWNAVDVLVNGQLQHGRVINVAEKALLIDFECPTQRAQLIEYGRVFQCKENAERSMTNVQVLLRRHPDAAWIWYPGRVIPIEGFLYEYAEYVEVRLPKGNVKELLPLAQVRPRSAGWKSKLRPMRRGDFMIRSCRMPTPGLSKQPAWVVKKFKAELVRVGKAAFISLLGDTLTYFQRVDELLLTMELLVSICKLAKKRSDTPRWSGPLTISSVSRTSRKRKISGSEAQGFPLPVEVLAEIFRSLDSIGRVRCRRVCPLWNIILTTEAYFPDVRVSGNCADGDYPAMDFCEDGMYWVVACVLKCLSSHTKTLMLSRLDLFECRQLIAPLHHVRPGRPVPTLVLFNCHLSGPLLDRPRDVIGSTVQLAVDLGCEQMLWKKCRFSDATLTAFIPRYAFRVQSSAALTVQLWELLESHLVLEEPLDRPGIAKWIANRLLFPLAHYITPILQGLHDYQSADPRPATPYRGRVWTASTLAQLDATQLTTLTAAFLQEGVKH